MNQRIKKEAEEQSLGYFLEAYEGVTGETMEVIVVSEKPDFICVRDDGGMVGIDLDYAAKIAGNIDNYMI